MARIGFVGLGHMGLPMAINLVKAGHRVTGYDLQQDAVQQFVKAGGMQAHAILEAGLEQDAVVTMLQTGQQVLQVCQGNEGLLALVPAGSLFIDCSTIDVDSARAVHQLAQEHQVLSVDAPVSGGIAGAAAGTLTFMVGGSEEAYAKAQPLLAAMGKHIIHTGSAGTGQSAKICNNMVLGISMIAVCEAFVLGKQLGLGEQKLFEVINNASGQCWALSHYVPVPGILDNVPANCNFQPGFTAAMMLKDLLLSQEAATSVHCNTALGLEATRLYRLFVQQGCGALDFSGIIQMIAEK